MSTCPILARFRKLPQPARMVLIHATRRWLTFGPKGLNNISYVAQGNGDKATLTNSWLSLGKAKYYQDAIDFNLVKPATQGLPANADQWWVLTPAGAEYVQAILEDKFSVEIILQNNEKYSEFQLWPDF